MSNSIIPLRHESFAFVTSCSLARRWACAGDMRRGCSFACSSSSGFMSRHNSWIGRLYNVNHGHMQPKICESGKANSRYCFGTFKGHLAYSWQIQVRLEKLVWQESVSKFYILRKIQICENCFETWSEGPVARGRKVFFSFNSKVHFLGLFPNF